MWLISLFVLYLIGSACADPIYFAGRSADIVIEADNAVKQNSAILLHGKYFEENSLKSIEDVHVADLLAHVMGTQPFNVLANRQGFPKGDLFNKPKATFFVTLDSVDPEVYSTYSTQQNYQKIELTTSSYPANTYTITSNLATGTDPSIHGIVSGSWISQEGDRVNAHISGEGISLAANLADIVSQEWAGNSLSVSASASPSLAATFAVHEQLSNENSFNLALSAGSFISLNSQSGAPFALSGTALLSLIQQQSFAHFLNDYIKYSNNKITVSAGTQQAMFDLATSVDFVFFGELAFVYNLINSLETDPRISQRVLDSTPDFYAFVFSSLKGIKEEAGENSEKYIVALKLVDVAIQNAIAKIDKLYNGRAISIIASLDTQTIWSEDLKQSVYSYTRDYLVQADDFERNFPSLYLLAPSRDQVCSNLKTAISSTDVTVHCFASSPTFNFVRAFVDSDTNGTNNTTPITPVTPLNVPAFWMLFFLPIVLVLFVLAGIFALTSADAEATKDSLLFRSAGRTHHHL